MIYIKSLLVVESLIALQIYAWKLLMIYEEQL